MVDFPWKVYELGLGHELRKFAARTCFEVMPAVELQWSILISHMLCVHRWNIFSGLMDNCQPPNTLSRNTIQFTPSTLYLATLRSIEIQLLKLFSKLRWLEIKSLQSAIFKKKFNSRRKSNCRATEEIPETAPKQESATMETRSALNFAWLLHPNLGYLQC